MTWRRVLKDVTIPNGTTTSGVIDASGDTLVGIQMPAAFTGTAITLLGSADGITYNAVNSSSGTAVSFTVAAAKFIVIPPDTNHAPYIKLVSGSTELADRILQVVLLPLGWR